MLWGARTGCRNTTPSTDRLSCWRHSSGGVSTTAARNAQHRRGRHHHLGLWQIALPKHQMALITSGCGKMRCQSIKWP